MANNYLTGQEYKGANDATLTGAAFNAGYKSNEWLTYLQAQEMGGTVKKGSKGVRIIKVIEDKEKHDIGVRYYTVFNVEQCENLDSDLKLTAEQYEIYKVLKKEMAGTRKAVAKTSALI